MRHSRIEGEGDGPDRLKLADTGRMECRPSSVLFRIGGHTYRALFWTDTARDLLGDLPDGAVRAMSDDGYFLVEPFPQ